MESKTSLSKEEILSLLDDAQITADKASSVQECLIDKCFTESAPDELTYKAQYQITSNLAFVANDYITKTIKILERVSDLLEGEETA